MKVAKVGFTDLQLRSTERETPVAFFTRAQANDIIAAAEEPFKTIFALAWYTGCRAGELLALTLADLNFDQRTIRVNKSSDDNTREIRQPKTKCVRGHATNAVRIGNSATELLASIGNQTPRAFCSLPHERMATARSRDNVVKCRSQTSAAEARHFNRETPDCTHFVTGSLPNWWRPVCR